MRTRNAVIITDHIDLARGVARYLRFVAGGNWETFYLTYEQREGRLSPTLTAETDLFILGLLRSYPGGMRAEAIPVAEVLIRTGKRVLVVSGGVAPGLRNVAMFWDLASDVSLADRIAGAADGAVNWQDGLGRLRETFSAYASPPVHGHHRSRPDAP